MRRLPASAFLLSLLLLGWYATGIAAPFAYITNSISNTVSVIDTASDTVTATIPASGPTPFATPHGVAVQPSGAYVYVTNMFGDTLSTISVTDGGVTAAGVGTSPVGVAVNPAGTQVYVADGALDTLSVIDTATNTRVTQVAVGQFPAGVAVHPDGSRVYVTITSNGTVAVVDTASNTQTAAITVGGWPYGVAVNPAGTRGYVANGSGNSVSVIDLDTNTVVATVPVGVSPTGVAVHPNGTRAYVTNSDDDTVAVIDTDPASPSYHTVIATVPVGGYPFGVAVHPLGGRVYVANNGMPPARLGDTVSVIGTACNAVIATVPVQSQPVAFGQFIGPLPAGPPDTTPPTAPTGLGANGVTGQSAWSNSNSFTITWTNPTDPSGIGCSFYKLGDPPASAADGTPAGGSSGISVTVPAEGSQNLHLWLEDGAGNLDFTTHAAVTLRYDGTAPADGTLTATSGDGRVDLSWSAATDPVSGLAATNPYKLVYSTTGYPAASCPGGALYEGPGSSFADTGVANGTTFYYRLCARDEAGNTSVGAVATAATPFSLSAAKGGTGSGTVTSSPPGITCGATCSALFAAGASVTLTATPATGSTFTGWIGAGVSCPGTGPCTVVMTQARTVSATFQDVTPPVMTHSPVTSWVANTTIPLTATVTDNIGVQAVTLFYRTTGAGGYTAVPMTASGATYSGTIPGSTVTHAGVQYYLEARDAASNLRRAPSTAPDIPYSVSVGTSLFTDDPLVAQSTPIKALHFTELRVAIDALRVQCLCGLGPFPWTDPILTPGSTPVRRVHLIDLRTALDEVYAKKGRSRGPYTDPAVTAGLTVIKASHVSELRSYIRALE